MGTERRWRRVALLAISILIGMVVAGTPAGAHVGGSVSHHWNQHLKPKADTRYAKRRHGDRQGEERRQARHARLDPVCARRGERHCDAGLRPIGSIGCSWFTINPDGVGDISDDVVLAIADNIPNGQVVVDTFQLNSTENFNIRLGNFLNVAIDPDEATFFWIILRMP